MRWNVTTSAYDAIKRNPPSSVKEVEALVTRVLSEADMDDSSTILGTEQHLVEAFASRADPVRFSVQVEMNSWGFWPRPKNLYTWITLCGFDPPQGIADEGNFDHDFLILSYKKDAGESLQVNAEKLTPDEKALFEGVREELQKAEETRVSETMYPTQVLDGNSIYSFPIDPGDSPVERKPQQALDLVLGNPDQIVAFMASLEEVFTLSAYLEHLVEKQKLHLAVVIVEPQTPKHTYWVLCMTQDRAKQMAEWFQAPRDVPAAH